MTARARTDDLVSSRCARALACATVLFASACVQPAAIGEGSHDGGLPAARLPESPGEWAPSFTRVSDGGRLDWQWLDDTASCEPCHADAVEQWRASSHAFSSFNNPYYRASVDHFRQGAGNGPSRFCGGCHDPQLLLGGAMDEEVRPEDPRAHHGVTCLVCHSIEAVGPNGNGDYSLTRAPVPMPVPGDPGSLERHRARLALAPLRTAELCGACHLSFAGRGTGNPFHLGGQEDFASWRTSSYAGAAGLLDEDVPRRDCRGCHMAPEPAPHGDASRSPEGLLASHRASASYTTMAAMRGDAQQLERMVAELRRAATIDVAAVRAADGTWFVPAERAVLAAGTTVVLDVVVRNVGVGHHFPAGTRDLQDTWIELVVQDAQGTPIAEAGTRHEQGDRDDPEAHRVRAEVLDEHGQPVLDHDVHRFRGAAYDHTVPPRGASVVRYALELPEQLPAERLPLRVQARLRHRKHMRGMQRAACEATTSTRGVAFAAKTRELGLPVLDGCLVQPVTDIASAVVHLGGGDSTRSEGGADRPLWRRLFDHALGLLGGLQERLDEARPSLAAGLQDAERRGDVRGRAMLLALRAQLESQQGRLDDALAYARRAERLAPGSPALARLRGRAFANVWRWREAADELARAAAATPRDETAWRELAVARGSYGADALALHAATMGLALVPRDESLLLNQSLAIERLRGRGAQRTREAYLAFRRPDDLPRLRNACNRTVEGCALERVPVHLHTLRATPR